MTDRSELAEWLIPELRAAGLAVSLPSSERSREAIEPPLTVCVADRGAKDDRGVGLSRATRAAGTDVPFVFIGPTRASIGHPPWEGRGVHRIEPYEVAALMECVRGKVIARDPALQVIDSKRAIGYRFIAPPVGDAERVPADA